jgi:membrane protease YdiL (CAAX protease family)
LGSLSFSIDLLGDYFGWARGNFWVKIGLSVTAVFLYSLFWQKPKISFQLRSVLFGFLSAAILYLIFLLGNKLASHILPGANAQVEGIYSLGAGTNRVFIFLLLFFITSPGEEIFWRAFLQDRFMKRWGTFPGYLIATTIYAGVHVFSWNLVLILGCFSGRCFSVDCAREVPDGIIDRSVKWHDRGEFV